MTLRTWWSKDSHYTHIPENWLSFIFSEPENECWLVTGSCRGVTSVTWEWHTVTWDKGWAWRKYEDLWLVSVAFYIFYWLHPWTQIKDEHKNNHFRQNFPDFFLTPTPSKLFVFLHSKFQLYARVPFRYLWPRVDIYLVKSQNVPPGPPPLKN